MRKPNIYLPENFMTEIWPKFTARFKNQATKNNYFSDLNTFLEFVKKELYQVTYGDCYSYIEHLNRLCDNNKLKKSTVSKKYKELSRLFSYIEQEYGKQYNFENHFRNIEVVHPESKFYINKLVSMADVDILLTYFKDINPSIYVAIILALKHMLTTSEITRLKVSNITVDAAEQQYLLVRQPNGHERYVKLSPSVYDILVNHSNSLIGGPFLISKDGVKPYANRTLQRYLHLACEELGISQITFNDLRNSGTVNSLSNGASVDEVKKEIGMKTDRHITKLSSLLVDYTAASEFINIELKKPSERSS